MTRPNWPRWLRCFDFWRTILRGCKVGERSWHTFRAFVECWYRGGLQRILFHENPPPPEVRRMIAAILAGYAWDRTDPYVAETRRRLAVLEELCSRP
jgi:hypothetical protein